MILLPYVVILVNKGVYCRFIFEWKQIYVCFLLFVYTIVKPCQNKTMPSVMKKWPYKREGLEGGNFIISVHLKSGLIRKATLITGGLLKI